MIFQGFYRFYFFFKRGERIKEKALIESYSLSTIFDAERARQGESKSKSEIQITAYSQLLK